MRKSLKKIMSLALAAVMTIGLCTGCGGGEDAGSDADLTVTYYEGGYGKEWIEYAAKKFEEEKNVTVKLISSAKLDCDATTYIKSGSNLSDIYICASSSWTSWAAQGKLEPLTDLYDMEVATSNGNVKIKDYIDQDVAGKYYMQQKAGQGEFIPWVMPWSAQPNALAYNEDLLSKLVHTESGYAVEGLNVGDTWTTPPKTVTELFAYCADVNAYSDDSGYTYVPFGWSGKAPEMLYFMIYSWWAQAQGITESNYEGEGSFFDFWNFGNTAESGQQSFSLDGFKQTGIKVAIDTLIDLMVKDGSYANSLPDAGKLSAQELQMTFVSGDMKTKPAIVLASSYLEYETELSGYLDTDKDGKQDVNFKFMPVPKLDSYTGEQDVVYCTYEDVMLIPKEAAHKDVAKEFLAYLCNEEMLNYFSSTTGSIRPFNYDYANASAEYSEFTKSVMDVYANSTHVFEYPVTVENMNQVSFVYRFERPTLFGIDPLTTVLNELLTMDGQEIMDNVIKNLETQTVGNWKSKYGLIVK